MEIPGFPGGGYDFGYAEAGAALAGLVVRDGSGLPRSGIIPSTANLITGRSDWNVDVAPFVVVRADGPRILLGGADASLQVAISPAPASNSRIDLVWALARNVDAGDLAGCVHVVTGVPGVAPVKPSLPAGGVELGTVTVPATATGTSSSTIANTFRRTVATGGVVPVRDAAELSAFSPVDGALVWRADTAQLLQYVATATTPGWFHVAGRSTFSTPTFINGQAPGSPAPQVASRSGMVFLSGLVVSVPAPFISGVTYTIGSVPAGVAPAAEKVFACTSNGTAVARISIDAAGTMKMILSDSFSGALSLSLDGCSWPDKNL